MEQAQDFEIDLSVLELVFVLVVFDEVHARPANPQVQHHLLDFDVHYIP